jgi:cytochrome c553
MNQPRTERGPHPLTRALGALLLCALPIASLNAPLRAQTHKVAAAENVVRAVGVYEWTGEMAKAAASRLIPVSLFIDGKFEDAAVYLARPVPFALTSGNVYELDQAGIALGTLDLAFARHMVASGAAATPYDDGWFGYGKFVPPAPPKVSTLKPSKTLGVINGLDDDDDRPHFSARSAPPGSGDAATPTSGAPASSTGTPAADPDRPTLHRTTGSADQSASSSSGDTRDTPANDPDRPTLRRHSPQDAAKNTAEQPDANSAVASLNDDPSRPLLHRGKPISALTDADIPKLAGLPADQDLHQMVAVSDAANRPSHDFSRAWEDEAEHQAILAKLQTAARAQLAAYETANAPPKAAAKPLPPDTRRINSKLRRTVVQETPPPPAPAPEPLLDEQLKGYTLSYGGAATYVYTAHTDGPGSTVRFVTLVAQVDMNGEPQLAIKSVTDAAHLDRAPRMRLVDAVDAEASNRASLLIELRAQNSRQFALYRVIGARAEQTFLTGSTQ